MQHPESNLSGAHLDARLLRFRSRPESEDARSLGHALLEAGRPADALEVVQARLATFPDDLDLLILEGRSWLIEGDLLRAQTALLRAARVAPVDAEPFRWLGEVLLRRGDPERAAKVLERAQDIAPTDRTIAALRERASRLSRVAEEVTGETVTELDATGLLEDDESTVVAPIPPAMVAASVPPPSAATRSSAFEDFEDDEGPTALLDRAGFAPPRSKPSRKNPPPPMGTLPYSAPPPRSSAPPPPARASKPSLPPPGRPTASVAPPPPLGEPVSPYRVTQSGLGAPSDVGEESSSAASTRWSSAPPPPPATRSSAPPPDTADAVLGVLQAQGVFELPSSDVAGWASRGEVTRSGTRVGWALALLWIVGLGAAGGGLYGYRHWTEQRKAEAARRVESAEALVLVGSNDALSSAERDLRAARELDPKNESVSATRLKLELTRVLEAAGPVGALRGAIGRVERDDATNTLLPLAEALAGFLEGRASDVRGALAATPEDDSDPWRAYVAGRLGQRMGDPRAEARLEAAVAREPRLAPASVALAAAHLDRGRTTEAREALDRLLTKQPEHLRAGLLRAYLAAVATNEPVIVPVELVKRADASDAPEEKAIARMIEARAARQADDRDRAKRALDQASRLGVTEPLLLGALAREARATGMLARAQQLASQAVTLAPGALHFRVLLAEILLARGDGAGALRTLTAISAEDPAVLRRSAEAALLVGSEEALGTALGSLDAALAADPGDGVLRAIRVRTLAKLGRVDEAFAQAKKLAKEVPGEPTVLLALGEIALAARDPKTALANVEKLVALDDENVYAHFLLGRARRMAGDAAGAQASFERALVLDPEHLEATVALGHLLLDRGALEDALARFEGLASKIRGASALVARLGRVEALLGLGRLAEASEVLEQSPAAERELASYQIMNARILLANGRAAEAVKVLRPFAEAEDANADVLTLFGDALYRIDEVDAAKARYDAALALDAGHPEALVGAAEVHVRAEKLRDAFAVIDRAESALKRRIRPPSLTARLLVLRARARIERANGGDLDAARSELRQAIELRGVPPEAHFFLGEALAGANSPEAKAAYERYLELDPKGPFAGRARRALR